MSVKSGLVSWLADNENVKHLVGTRIRIGHSHESDTLPRIVLVLIDADHADHLLAATGKAIGRFQINCYGETPKQADEVATAVREALHGRRGLADDTWISMISLNDERDTYDPPQPGRDTEGGIDGIQLDFRVGWTESIPTFS